MVLVKISRCAGGMMRPSCRIIMRCRSWKRCACHASPRWRDLQASRTRTIIVDAVRDDGVSPVVGRHRGRFAAENDGPRHPSRLRIRRRVRPASFPAPSNSTMARASVTFWRISQPSVHLRSRRRANPTFSATVMEQTTRRLKTACRIAPHSSNSRRSWRRCFARPQNVSGVGWTKPTRCLRSTALAAAAAAMIRPIRLWPLEIRSLQHA